MKRIVVEAITVNLIIVIVLSTLGIYSGISVNVFNGSIKPIYRAQREGKTVSLMINVYEGNEWLEGYLEILDKENITATVFVGGIWAEKNGDLVKKIATKHEIGNHGYNHKLHTRLSQEESRSEIQKTNKLIEKYTGKKCTLFAPPSGDVNESVVNDATACGCNTIMWTVDTIDWREKDVNKILGRVERKLEDGAFILTHPTEATVKALPEMILYIKAKGYSFVTVGSTL